MKKLLKPIEVSSFGKKNWYNFKGKLMEGSPRIMKSKIPNKKNLVERHFHRLKN